MVAGSETPCKMHVRRCEMCSSEHARVNLLKVTFIREDDEVSPAEAGIDWIVDSAVVCRSYI